MVVKQIQEISIDYPHIYFCNVELALQVLQIWNFFVKCFKISSHHCKMNLPIQCTGQPRDSDDQISEHNCCRWNNEMNEEGDKANMSRRT